VQVERVRPGAGASGPGAAGLAQPGPHLRPVVGSRSQPGGTRTGRHPGRPHHADPPRRACLRNPRDGTSHRRCGPPGGRHPTQSRMAVHGHQPRTGPPCRHHPEKTHHHHQPGGASHPAGLFIPRLSDPRPRLRPRPPHPLGAWRPATTTNLGPKCRHDHRSNTTGGPTNTPTTKTTGPAHSATPTSPKANPPRARRRSAFVHENSNRIPAPWVHSRQIFVTTGTKRRDEVVATHRGDRVWLGSLLLPTRHQNPRSS
jgi:hypothetical protein